MAAAAQTTPDMDGADASPDAIHDARPVAVADHMPLNVTVNPAEVRLQIDYILKAPADLYTKLSSKKRDDLFGHDFVNQKVPVKRQSMRALQQYLETCRLSRVPQSEAYGGPGVIIDVLRSKSAVNAINMPYLSFLVDFASLFFPYVTFREYKVQHPFLDKDLQRWDGPTDDGYGQQAHCDDVLTSIEPPNAPETPKDSYGTLTVVAQDLLGDAADPQYPDDITKNLKYTYMNGSSAQWTRDAKDPQNLPEFKVLCCVSMARAMTCENGDPLPEKEAKRRAMKLMAKFISMMLCLGECYDYRCLMNPGLDDVALYYCPYCYEKIATLLGWISIERSEALEDFFRINGFDQDSKWELGLLNYLRKTPKVDGPLSVDPLDALMKKRKKISDSMSDADHKRSRSSPPVLLSKAPPINGTDPSSTLPSEHTSATADGYDNTYDTINGHRQVLPPADETRTTQSEQGTTRSPESLADFAKTIATTSVISQVMGAVSHTYVVPPAQSVLADNSSLQNVPSGQGPASASTKPVINDSPSVAFSERSTSSSAVGVHRNVVAYADANESEPIKKMESTATQPVTAYKLQPDMNGHRMLRMFRLDLDMNGNRIVGTNGAISHWTSPQVQKVDVGALGLSGTNHDNTTCRSNNHDRIASPPPSTPHDTSPHSNTIGSAGQLSSQSMPNRHRPSLPQQPVTPAHQSGRQQPPHQSSVDKRSSSGSGSNAATRPQLTTSASGAATVVIPALPNGQMTSSPQQPPSMPQLQQQHQARTNVRLPYNPTNAPHQILGNVPRHPQYFSSSVIRSGHEQVPRHQQQQQYHLSPGTPQHYTPSNAMNQGVPSPAAMASLLSQAGPQIFNRLYASGTGASSDSRIYGDNPGMNAGKGNAEAGDLDAPLGVNQSPQQLPASVSTVPNRDSNNQPTAPVTPVTPAAHPSKGFVITVVLHPLLNPKEDAWRPEKLIVSKPNTTFADLRPRLWALYELDYGKKTRLPLKNDKGEAVTVFTTDEKDGANLDEEDVCADCVEFLNKNDAGPGYLVYLCPRI
ncbi:hypothetical protein SeMB42_g03755 [Synchytrium endobioticum]|uniref:Uncharacterized protein n=1 Tax=Synchytrium endobioticum TaxID=286115 RepID=A0A507D477_9FUNG|nr:hypothetical protein SeLEV6574_g05726 [Synchytrium endobioticum]TPX46309.1 hypothetical protein SeMB42_g03755 [Synchytrium endobioticum]